MTLMTLETLKIFMGGNFAVFGIFVNFAGETVSRPERGHAANRESGVSPEQYPLL